MVALGHHEPALGIGFDVRQPAKIGRHIRSIAPAFGTAKGLNETAVQGETFDLVMSLLGAGRDLHPRCQVWCFAIGHIRHRRHCSPFRQVAILRHEETARLRADRQAPRALQPVRRNDDTRGLVLSAESNHAALGDGMHGAVGCHRDSRQPLESFRLIHQPSIPGVEPGDGVVLGIGGHEQTVRGVAGEVMRAFRDTALTPRIVAGSRRSHIGFPGADSMASAGCHCR